MPEPKADKWDKTSAAISSMTEDQLQRAVRQASRIRWEALQLDHHRQKVQKDHEGPYSVTPPAPGFVDITSESGKAALIEYLNELKRMDPSVAWVPVHIESIELELSMATKP